MFKQNRAIIKTIFLIVGIFEILFSFSSCGFAYKKHVIGKYYIIGVDDKNDLGLSYSIGSGDFVGKAPGTIIEYGYNDTFLVAKTKEYDKTDPCYYIINMTKDSELAHEDVFRIGPLTEKDFKMKWGQRLKLYMTRAD